ncbi:MAG: right-handed parallel beta-helix repeat-containing protein, partial [Halanaerobiales bacterium]|nr:right-handed parallel beta-helix repeat-containing protein [Halanaerobiales bacterium]
RSKTVIQGSGAGKGGTVLFFQRPLKYTENPPELAELREYLVNLDKRQREPENGVDILFSQYSWSGGYFWVAKKGARHKPYLSKYNKPLTIYAKAKDGKQGASVITVNNPSGLAVGQAYKLCWFNKDGKDGSFLKHMYDNQDVKIGSHHWTNAESPLVNQMVLVTDIKGNKVTIKDPLLHHVKPEWHCALIEWEHIEEVGIENMSFEFPVYPDLPHHCEEGNNAIYLTGLMNGWVKNVRFKNADSGILTDDISNVTIENIHTLGDKLAHYSVAMGEVHNVLVKKLRVENRVRHPLSFNTRSTKCVYTNCVVEKNPILDQHSGANQQNLFDNLKVYIDEPIHETFEYPLFMSGGAGYWAPAHGAFSTFYNVEVNFSNIPSGSKPILLNGVKGGASARLIGVHANHLVAIDYEPNSYIERTNIIPEIKSLYDHQL